MFSNAPQHYAHEVLKLLRDRRSVRRRDGDGAHALPAQAGYFRLHATDAQAPALRPPQCVMVEDSLENLRAAKRLGMRTVWVNAGDQIRASYVDVKIRDVMQLPRALRRLN